MYTTSLFAAAVAFVLAVQASPVELESRTVFGCQFTGDGIVKQPVTVGSDYEVLGDSGVVHILDCGTTEQQIVPGIFAKCTVDNKIVKIRKIEGDDANIACFF